MAEEALETRAAERDADFFPLNDLPNELIVSVFAAVEDPTWVRYTFPLVCKAWNELYLTKDASPLHETLEVDFHYEASRAAAAQAAAGAEVAAAESESASEDEESESESEEDDEEDDEEEDDEEEERAPRRPVVHASRVIAWAERRAGSVRKLHVNTRWGGINLKDFRPEDFVALVAVVGSSLTGIRIDSGVRELLKKPFWESLRDSVVPARRLRSLVVRGIDSAVNESDVEPLGQLAGSLEELELRNDFRRGRDLQSGLPRFLESLCALTELRRLNLGGHKNITAIPAGISSLKKLEDLNISLCDLSSLPKELGDLSALTSLNLSFNPRLGTTLPAAEAFPAELGKLKSLRRLRLFGCGLRALPAFVGELESLEVLDLFVNDDLQIPDPLDFLLERCPRLREVRLENILRTPESRAHLEAFKAKLLAKDPNAIMYF